MHWLGCKRRRSSSSCRCWITRAVVLWCLVDSLSSRRPNRRFAEIMITIWFVEIAAFALLCVRPDGLDVWNMSVRMESGSCVSLVSNYFIGMTCYCGCWIKCAKRWLQFAKWTIVNFKRAQMSIMLLHALSCKQGRCHQGSPRCLLLIFLCCR